MVVAAALLALAVPSAILGSRRENTAASTQRYLPNCVGQPLFRPRSVTLACADGYFGVDRISWVAWGSVRAVGLGRAWANDCKPSCVAGHTRHYSAVLILTGSQRCPSGELAYRKITYGFIGRSPFPADAPGTLIQPRRRPARAEAVRLSHAS